jgi:hypothetical protein
MQTPKASGSDPDRGQGCALPQIPNRGAWLLWRTEGDRAEFVTVSFWESRRAIEAFAGQDIDVAVFYPDDNQFLIEDDLTVSHYEVAGTQ